MTPGSDDSSVNIAGPDPSNLVHTGFPAMGGEKPDEPDGGGDGSGGWLGSSCGSSYPITPTSGTPP